MILFLESYLITHICMAYIVIGLPITHFGYTARVNFYRNGCPFSLWSMINCLAVKMIDLSSTEYYCFSICTIQWCSNWVAATNNYDSCPHLLINFLLLTASHSYDFRCNNCQHVSKFVINQFLRCTVSYDFHHVDCQWNLKGIVSEKCQ